MQHNITAEQQCQLTPAGAGSSGLYRNLSLNLELTSLSEKGSWEMRRGSARLSPVSGRSSRTLIVCSPPSKRRSALL